jgi:hypothetical protein
MPVVNHTTKIAALKTVSEMQQMLAEYGAMRIGVDYANGGPVALSFALEVRGEPQIFSVPANVEAMRLTLMRWHAAGRLRSLSKREAASTEHAQRVAWRILKDWLAAQLALIDSSMVEIDQVMLPYMRVTADGRSLYEVIREQGLPQLEARR